jgi:hypothetical protein
MTTSQEEVLTYYYQYHREISRYDFGPTRLLLCCSASTGRYILSLAAVDVLVKGKIPSRHPWRFFGEWVLIFGIEQNFGAPS